MKNGIYTRAKKIIFSAVNNLSIINYTFQQNYRSRARYSESIFSKITKRIDGISSSAIAADRETTIARLSKI